MRGAQESCRCEYYSLRTSQHLSLVYYIYFVNNFDLDRENESPQKFFSPSKVGLQYLDYCRD